MTVWPALAVALVKVTCVTWAGPAHAQTAPAQAPYTGAPYTGAPSTYAPSAGAMPNPLVQPIAPSGQTSQVPAATGLGAVGAVPITSSQAHSGTLGPAAGQAALGGAAAAPNGRGIVGVGLQALCQPVTTAQLWFVRSTASGPLLVRRAVLEVGGVGTEQAVDLGFGTDDFVMLPSTAPASPYLYLTSVSEDGSGGDGLRFVVLCRENLRVLVDARVRPDLELTVYPELAAEVPGEGFVVGVDEQRTLLWRNGMPEPQLIDWPQPLRALAAAIDESFRVVALTSTGRLYEAVSLAAERDSPVGAPRPVAGWASPANLTEGSAPAYLGDARPWVYLLTQKLGLRFRRGGAAVETFYDGRGNDLRFVTHDRFPSASGDGVGLMLLLSDGPDPATATYTGRIYNMGDAIDQPVLAVDFTDIFQGDVRSPSIFLQGWEEDFSEVSGVMAFNRAGRASVSQLRIGQTFDPRRRQWRVKATVVDTETFVTEVLPEDLGLIVGSRRERVFSLKEGLDFDVEFPKP